MTIQIYARIPEDTSAADRLKAARLLGVYFGPANPVSAVAGKYVWLLSENVQGCYRSGFYANGLNTIRGIEIAEITFERFMEVLNAS